MTHSKASIANNAKIKAQAAAKGKKVLQLNKPKPQAPIQLNKPKKKGLAALVEKDTFVGQAAKAATSLKTTAVLATTLASLGILGAGAGAFAGRAAFTKSGEAIVRGTVGKGSIGAITSTKTLTQPLVIAGKQIAQRGATITQQWGFVGRGGSTIADKIFKAFPKTAATGIRYGNNIKTRGLTTSILRKSGFSTKNALTIAGIAGTYPFAIFELAEATDKIGIAMFRASQEGDAEKVAELREDLRDITDLENWEKAIGILPFANVYGAVTKNINAAKISADAILEVTQNAVEKSEAEAIAKAEEPTFADQQAASREQTLANRAEDTEFFDQQREKTRQADADKRAFDAEFFGLIQEGKHAEADALRLKFDEDFL